MRSRRILIVLGVCLLGAGGALWWRTAAAEQVQWDLSAAAQRGDLAEVRRLVEHRGARADAWPKRGDHAFGMSAINSAVIEGHTAVAAYLLDHGADIETGESDIRSPLALAIGRGYIATAEMLLNRGANANAAGHPLARMNLASDLRELLESHGAIDDTILREVPPMHLLCVSRLVNDRTASEFANHFAAEIRRAAENAGARVTGPLHLIYRGRNPRRAYLASAPDEITPSYELEVALPVYEFTHNSPPGFYYRIATPFKSVAAETKGERKTIETGWWILENAVFNEGLGPTYEVREVYRAWHGFGAVENVIELQCGLFGATRTQSGELDYGHDDRAYIRGAFR